MGSGIVHVVGNFFSQNAWLILFNIASSPHVLGFLRCEISEDESWHVVELVISWNKHSFN